MNSTITIHVRNSELQVAKEKRICLTYPATGLADCRIEETEDSVIFTFDTVELSPAHAILEKPKWEQIRFLINCASIESLRKEYVFPLSLDNMMIDINLVPEVLLRDSSAITNFDFLQTYKALIGSVLLPRYGYLDYLKSSGSHYKKHKLLSELASLDTTAAIKSRLLESYRLMINDINTSKKLVPKKNVWISRAAIPLLSILLAAVVFFGGRMMFIDIPFRNSVIAANTAYISGDFLTVQRELRDYDINALSVDTRFFLSRAYVSTEALTDTQRNNILMGLAQLTDPIIFDYWILLGRLYFAEAIDIAQRLGDDELLLFAYLKHEVFIRQDNSMPGEERVALLSYLENNINRLNNARNEATGG